ncbi:bifunctional 2-polyprenyl-6-hydroxyphenol methylase/3-demethylubiquinol 3-O-methyltransferase UbiG [Chitinophaga sp. XS-30]|uniref:class I SAM-dependent methyltransferase n=1 Tax=Chitinophaga sp. XS-30 TaxID=2604421 RepID=UPI0011DD0CA5|nr:methyltransferase domain-containing protein [Chitinophaga sp. XS-30]QEH41736.1 methyltransferase domain-containing protein [Chitinophaga sp. XS-30]
MNAQSHYDNHLAAFYAWMTGNFDTKQQEQETYFSGKHIKPAGNAVAIDLGAGHGLQTISLANLGFTVYAVDFNQHLLSELNARAKGMTVRTILANIANTTQYSTMNAELITCMGDTLTHLESVQQVNTLFGEWYSMLPAGGKLVLSFRDLTQELEKEERFIPIRAEDERIHTCFLEYFPGYVRVFDVLMEKQNGQWIQKVSSYQKLRLGIEQVKIMLTAAGFAVQDHEVIQRMHYLVAQKLKG